MRKRRRFPPEFKAKFVLANRLHRWGRSTRIQSGLCIAAGKEKGPAGSLRTGPPVSLAPNVWSRALGTETALSIGRRFIQITTGAFIGK
jgi:hypothetical protein